MNDLSVEVKNLSVRFGDFTAVDDVSFSVRRAEIFGFLGANGAGKTTTIRVLCGLIVPTHGDVRVAGIGFEQGEMKIKAKVGYMSQKFTLYNDLTVEENLDFTACLRKLQKAEYLRRRKDLLDMISFDRPLNSPVSSLPGGLKQQVSLVSSMIHDPEIVFLDEPTAGVTPASRARFWALIRKIADHGKTVFVTTHYMDEAEQCGRIALMRSGKLIALDSPSGLKKSTFPIPVYEFEPKTSMSFQEISKLKRSPVFSFFEPYGTRFHASPTTLQNWDQEKVSLAEKFLIRQITPSLEDVFIRAVEGKKGS